MQSGSPEAVVARLQAYQQRLAKAGRLIEVRAVRECIKIVRAARQSAPESPGSNAAASSDPCAD